MSEKSRSCVIRNRCAACSALHNIRVGATGQLLGVNRIDIVTTFREDRDEAVRQILVQFDLHR
jgi:hypothetical protein